MGSFGAFFEKEELKNLFFNLLKNYIYIFFIFFVRIKKYGSKK